MARQGSRRGSSLKPTNACWARIASNSRCSAASFSIVVTSIWCQHRPPRPESLRVGPFARRPVLPVRWRNQRKTTRTSLVQHRAAAAREFQVARSQAARCCPSRAERDKGRAAGVHHTRPPAPGRTPKRLGGQPVGGYRVDRRVADTDVPKTGRLQMTLLLHQSPLRRIARTCDV